MVDGKNDDGTTETDFRVLDVTRTMTKETVVDLNIGAVMIVREPQPEQIVEMKPTEVDVDLRGVVVPVTVPADAKAETEAADDDATLVDSARALPAPTPTASVTVGSAPAVRRFNVDE